MLERARQLIARWRKEPTLPLCHYTSGDGLLGIVRSGVLLGFNFSFMNDRSELMYGLDLLRDVLEARQKRSGGRLEDAYIALLLTSAVPTDIDVYLTCFCEKRDLLSQWRGYGTPEGRYCIEFDAAGFDAARSEVTPIAHIVYDERKQREILTFVFDEHLRTLREDARHSNEDTALRKAADCLYRCSLIPLAFFKDAAFSEEHEWRSVAIGPPSDFVDCVDFASASGIMKPYIPLLKGRSGKLPIRQVIAGASKSPGQATKSAALILARFGYEVPIRPSKIPLTA